MNEFVSFVMCLCQRREKRTYCIYEGRLRGRDAARAQRREKLTSSGERISGEREGEGEIELRKWTSGIVGAVNYVWSRSIFPLWCWWSGPEWRIVSPPGEMRTVSQAGHSWERPERLFTCAARILSFFNHKKKYYKQSEYTCSVKGFTIILFREL